LARARFAQVGHLVEQEREAGLGLGDAEPSQVEVDNRLAELGQVDPGCLDAVAVGHVEEVDPWHGPASRRAAALLLSLTVVPVILNIDQYGERAG